MGILTRISMQFIFSWVSMRATISFTQFNSIQFHSHKVMKCSSRETPLRRTVNSIMISMFSNSQTSFNDTFMQELISHALSLWSACVSLLKKTWWRHRKEVLRDFHLRNAGGHGPKSADFESRKTAFTWIKEFSVSILAQASDLCENLKSTLWTLLPHCYKWTAHMEPM